MSYTANKIQKKLLTELANYINTQYFGKTPLLLSALSERLKDENILCKEPYIESSAAYKTVPNGFEKINLPEWLKKFFLRLAEAKLGVYPSPFAHQVQALEFAMQGKDLFVSTGTGSGKTECFIFPMLAKLATEAHNSPATWQSRGVRVMIMYPMNALVSDQISRLRKLLGDTQGNFQKIFTEICGENSRRPQFGMYTGRTPYSGKIDKSQDLQLASTIEEITQQENFNKLAEIGRIPAKANIQNFLAKIENGLHIPDADDAELVTRFEMQNFCPDILITNYSMLEYMLMRPIEEKIWSDTKNWLESSPENKLLFVIDEAHMYKGSAGGEVALLIRRLFYKLGVFRDKVQFILTTASMPPDFQSVKNFFKNLTAADSADNFKYLTGDTEKLPDKPKFDIDAEKILQFKSEDFEGNEEIQFDTLKKFLSQIDNAPKNFSNLQEIYFWLYENLTDYRPFAEMLKLCRGQSISLNELAKNIFPNLQLEKALQAVSILLAIAPLAKKDNAVLFPVRMHMLFRGLKGVYACTNPNCSHSHSYEKLTLGKIFLSDGVLTCPDCQSVVYELYNDRHCGTLFFKGYIFEGDLNKERAYLWRESGQILDKSLKEIHLFIPPENYEPPKNLKDDIKPCYLDVKSGFIYFSIPENQKNLRKLYYSKYQVKGRPDLLTFSKCPHCLHSFSYRQLTSFSTRGNQSFYNLIKAQFQNQPPVFKKFEYPNQGRKVLLFSDSRQRAATLARDMSDFSDHMAERQLFAIAANEMAQSSLDLSLNDLYDYFCLAAGQKNIQLFSGVSRENFVKNCTAIINKINRGKKFRPKTPISDSPDEMKEIILRFFCAGQNTLYDNAISWLEPTEDELENALDKLKENGVKVSEDEFLEIFNAWLIYIFDNHTALGNNFSKNVRESVRRPFGGFGLTDDWKFSTTIRNICNWDEKSQTMHKWRRVLNNFLLKNSEDGRLYVDIGKLKICFDLNHKWHRCERCKEITPYLLKNSCPNCGNDSTHILNAGDFKALEFWQKPIKDALQGKTITVIDTEEHTAQLSHKDQRENFWAQTEKYELRFQDLLKNSLPVDILSCTTTMEVGIDIGSLIAVGLRNIPPMRENYQQRAGRAGRRGSSLSTIVTFCGDNPHDNLYFNNPAPMFNGEPRKPYIDIESEKLIHRHLTIILFQKFLAKNAESLDSIPAAKFLDNQLDAFKNFLINFKLPEKNILLPTNFSLNVKKLREEIFESLNALKLKRNLHPEIFGVNNNGEISKSAKTLLDALWEEGIIPTFSFPKNVVSVFIPNDSGKIEYQPDRGLDIAISEYAPGRSIVVDKQTYQIGGIYFHGNKYQKEWRKDPARKFIEDKNYLKNLLTCDKCGWFGLAEENYKQCPFCGNENLKSENPMLKPWGFAPKNALPISQAQLEEEYSFAQPPEYSTLPENDEMTTIKSFKNIRLASRKNQRIIMLNKGSADKGFVICKDCGAAMPNTKEDNPLKNIGRPYKSNFNCQHSNKMTVNLGFDFITDMLVLEIALDNKKIDTRNDNKNLWLIRAAQSLAEAFRLATSQELDVDFNELVTGYRIRRTDTEKTFVDVYIYDNLSSGAGYSVRITSEIENLLNKTREILNSCDCESACQNCLKHYRNQFVHGRLDRFYGLNLLDWAISEKLADEIPFDTQKKYFDSVKSFFNISEVNKKFYLEIKNRKYEVIIYPAMLAEKFSKDKIYICDSFFKYAKPYIFNQIEDFLKL